MKSFPHKHFAMLFCLALLLAAMSPALAKGPPSGECKSVCVDSAEPPDAMQGRDETVFIGGEGFDEGSSVRFLVSGSRDDSQIVVDRVQLVQDTESPHFGKLKADIRVKNSALVAAYDIEVQTLSGRKGKGTTLFAVKENPNQSSDVFTPVEIEAAYYERISGDPPTDDILEEGSPHTGGAHPWTGEYTYPGGPTFSWNFDNWTANTLDVTPRPCLMGASLNDPPTAGRYDCFDGAGGNVLWLHGGLVSIPLAGMNWTNVTVSKNGRDQDEPGFCPLLNLLSKPEMKGFLEFGATRYTLFFMEGCDVGVSCPISIITLSYSGVSEQQGGGQLVQLHPFHDLEGLPDIGRMRLTGFVTSMPIDAKSGELNVFTEPQDLTIGKFQIELRNVKNAALEAVCETTPGTVANIRFKTAPVNEP